MIPISHWKVMNEYPMIPIMRSMSRVLRNWIFRFASALWAETICLPLPTATVRITGLLGSSELGYTRISCSSSLGNSSAIAFASMDFPVPGLPIIMTCLRWIAAFLMTSTACSWPITWSISLAGTSIKEEAPTGVSGTVFCSSTAGDSGDSMAGLSSVWIEQPIMCMISFK